MATLPYISADRVRELLKWDPIYQAMETALVAVAEERAFQNARSATKVPGKDQQLLFTMPGYLEDREFGSLGCKLVTYFAGNSKRDKPLPTILAKIMLFDPETGDAQAVGDSRHS